jgi:hypothetical protein
MMKLHVHTTLLLFAVVVTSSSPDVPSTTTTICLQSIAKPPVPFVHLAEIQYDPSTLSAEFASYDAPELSSKVKLVRIGTCDTATHVWKSSTSITSAESFNKGYAPVIILSLDTHGSVIGVTCKSSKVDAGQTRDFGPKVKVVKMTKGKKPDLNRPVVVSKEGTVEGEVPEKTMLQKCVMVEFQMYYLLTNFLQVLVGGCRRHATSIGDRRWRQIDTPNPMLSSFYDPY